MYRYYIFVLAICGRGFALPALMPNGINGSLIELAKSCGNQIIAAEVTKRSEGCRVSAPPYDEKQVQCLLFYDVNKQLCSTSAKINIEQDMFIMSLKDKLKTLDLCILAKKWILHELDDYPLYHNKMSKLFENEVSCGKICSEPDLFNDNSNFYCNYFQWGTQLLHSLATPTAQPQSNISKTDASPVDLSSPTQLETESSAQDKTIIETVKPSIKTESKATEETAKENTTKPILSHKNLTVTAGAENNSVNPETVPLKVEDISKMQVNKLDETDTKIDKPIIKDPKVAVNADEVKDVPPGDGEDEDYQDMDEDKDEFPEPNININTNSAMDKLFPEVDGEKNKQKQKVNKAPTTSFDTELEPKVPAMAYAEDGYQSSDDNFFPFFLSMVITVVLVYVLYHNKSRVTKMFLGLIVEGRQQSRRRDSRGHFYRRLDTLEQAMTTDTAAAPSKIIY